MTQPVHLPAFFLGVTDKLFEGSPSDSMSGKGNINGSILPTIDKQTKWKYAHGQDFLRFSDGAKVYSFELGHDLPKDSKIVDKLPEVSLSHFAKDAISTGTAQVHRAAPDSLYVTLANGSSNPTFKLDHHDGATWKYSPAKTLTKRIELASNGSKPMRLDPESILLAATSMLKKAYLDLGGATNLLVGTGNAGTEVLKWKATHPVTSMAGAVALANTLPEMLTGHKVNETQGLILPVAGSVASSAAAAKALQAIAS